MLISAAYTKALLNQGKKAASFRSSSRNTFQQGLMNLHPFLGRQSSLDLSVFTDSKFTLQGANERTVDKAGLHSAAVCSPCVRSLEHYPRL